jgi:hypothetical protein
VGCSSQTSNKSILDSRKREEGTVIETEIRVLELLRHVENRETIREDEGSDFEKA